MLAARVEPKNGPWIAAGPQRCANGGVIGRNIVDVVHGVRLWTGAVSGWSAGSVRATIAMSANRRSACLATVSVRHICASFVDGDPARELMDRARKARREFALDSTSAGPQRCANGGVIGRNIVDVVHGVRLWTGAVSGWSAGSVRATIAMSANRRSACLATVSVRHVCASFVDGDPARELMDRARKARREFALDSTSRTERSNCRSRTRKNKFQTSFTPYAPSVLTLGKAAHLISLFRNRLPEQTPFTHSSPDADRR